MRLRKGGGLAQATQPAPGAGVPAQGSVPGGRCGTVLGRHGGPCTQMCTHAPQSEKGTSVHMHRASHPVPCCPGLVPVSLELTPGKHAGKSQLIQGGPLTPNWHLTLQHFSLPKAPPAPPPSTSREEQSPQCGRGVAVLHFLRRPTWPLETPS